MPTFLSGKKLKHFLYKIIFPTQKVIHKISDHVNKCVLFFGIYLIRVLRSISLPLTTHPPPMVPGYKKLRGVWMHKKLVIPAHAVCEKSIDVNLEWWQAFPYIGTTKVHGISQHATS